MGDRADCTLRITGLLHTSQLETLARQLKYACVPYPLGSESHSEALRKGDDNFFFDQVDYRHLDPDIIETLQEAKLAYFWEWRAGGCYEAGIQIYDPFQDITEEFGITDGAIAISVSDALDPQKLSKATIWHEFSKLRGVQVFTSNHDLLRLSANGATAVDPRFFALHQ